MLCSTGKVLYVYDDEDVDRLNILLTTHSSFEALAPIGKRNSSGESVWLIHVPDANKTALEYLFKRTPLRLDSQTYAITRQGNGQGNDNNSQTDTFIRS